MCVMSKKNPPIWLVDADLFEINELRHLPNSLCILFGRKYLILRGN